MGPLTLASAIAARATAFAWPPLVGFARATVVQLLTRIERGKLTITTPDGEAYTFGDCAREDTEAQLIVNDDVFWFRLLIFADMVSRTACSSCGDRLFG